MRLSLTAVALAAAASLASASRSTFLLNYGFKFQPENSGPPPACPDPNGTFPEVLDNQQCLGLNQLAYITNAADCEAACCADDTCGVWQWCPDGATNCSPAPSCWTGPLGQCQNGPGWISRGRSNLPPPPGPGNNTCVVPQCKPGTDDSQWRVLNLPHDFVVEGNYSETADKSHGYLPYGKGWYRKHVTVPANLASAQTILLEFEGIAGASMVYWNGNFVGNHTSFYTAGQYFIDPSIVNFGSDNVIAVSVDATAPDGWWFDGGGMYRNSWLTIIQSPGPFIAPWGVYVPSNNASSITWNNGVPSADSTMTPYVEVWNNASTTQSFTVNVQVVDADGNIVGTSSGSGSVAGNGNTTWSPSSPIMLKGATLWHLVYPPNKPYLYEVMTTLSVGGTVVDTHNVTTGIRNLHFTNDTGLWLNGVNTKILGTANHQDGPAFGVAVPDHFQWARVGLLKTIGVNGWRTAHNVPTPALLDATDDLGFLVWDENHRNGQLDQVPYLVKRDRNHPSVVIWSICNEVLCNTNSWIDDALAMKALMKQLDPYGQRVVSANQNGWLGPNTPLDLQGIDYSTSSYDSIHSQAPGIPSISSETSSAVSDRGEYTNDAVSGHVSSFDNQYPGWGESAEQAWGGYGETNNQGILTRAWNTGGWTWTGHDYRGEPTPYGWPDVNSHFGIFDAATFEKDRAFWYKTAFINFNPALPGTNPPTQRFAWILPHWNWQAGTKTDVWVFANADEVELFVNGNSQGRKPVPTFGHAEWDAISYAPGSLHAVAYVNNQAVAEDWKNTTGAPAALSVGIRAGFGSLYSGCNDVALVEVNVTDSNGLLVWGANNTITFSITGPGTLQGTSNGDPACLVPSTAIVKPAYHGRILAVVRGPNAGQTGTVVVTASADGLTGGSVNIPVSLPDGTQGKWCHLEPTL